MFNELHDHRDRNELDAATAVARRILDACSECPHACEDLARLLIVRGDYDEANRVADVLLMATGQGDERALCLKGEATRAGEGPEAAIPWFKRAAAIRPDSHGANCELAWTLSRLTDHKGALEYARRARLAAPDAECANTILIYTLRTLGRRTELRAVLPQARRVSSDDARYWDQVARGYYTLGRYTTALKVCAKAASLDPGLVNAHCLRAHIYWAMERWADAEKALLSLKEIDPEHHAKSCLIDLADLQGTKRGNWRLALDYIVQARVQFPHDQEVEQAYVGIADGLAREVSQVEQERQEWTTRLESERERHLMLEQVLEGFTLQEKGIPLAYALQEGESERIEFVDRFPDQARDLAKEIAAFSTSNDGTIFLGIEDDGTVCGIAELESLESKDKMRNRLGGVTSKGISPPAQVEVYFLPHADKTVVKIFVPKGPEPVYYVDGRPYLRHLDQSRSATPPEVTRLITEHYSRGAS